jgi:hypothetical protein
MLEQLNCVKPGVIVYLSNLNPNIKWNEFLDNSVGRSDNYILSRIKSLVWVDKSDGIESIDESIQYLDYYTDLLNKYDIRYKSVYIIVPADNYLPEYISIILNRKLKTLHSILELYNIQYFDVEPANIKNTDMFVIPLGYITYDIINIIKNPMIRDSFHNFYSNDSELILNNIILAIEAYIHDEPPGIYGMIKENTGNQL